MHHQPRDVKVPYHIMLRHKSNKGTIGSRPMSEHFKTSGDRGPFHSDLGGSNFGEELLFHEGNRQGHHLADESILHGNRCDYDSDNVRKMSRRDHKDKNCIVS